MLKGDISNRNAPIIAFNVDNLLFKDTQDKSILKSLKFKLSSPSKQYFLRDVDYSFINIINRVWNKYTYSIYFISTNPEVIDELNELLLDLNVCYTNLVCVTKDELRILCRNQYIYYFDSDADLLSYLSCNGAIHIDNIETIL